MSATRRRNRTAVLLATTALTGLACGVAALPAGAAPRGAAPGSGLSQLDMTATATAVDTPFYESKEGVDVAGEVPYATATLEGGGISNALSSVAWPGDTGGSGGSTLYLLGPICIPPDPTGLVPLPVSPPVQIPCPASIPQLPQADYNKFNDTEDASVQSGFGPSTKTLSQPGVKMTATATATHAASQAGIDGSDVPKLSEVFGPTTAATDLKLTGPKTATATATSSVGEVSIDGTITITSISSTASATTAATTGSGTASTTISGMSVAGVPVTIGSGGIKAKSTDNGSLSTLNATVNSALKKAGIQVFLAQASRKVSGSSVTLSSGSLIVDLDNANYETNANDTGTLLQLGGVSITASSSKGYIFTYRPAPAVKTHVSSTGTTAAVSGTTSTPTGSSTVPSSVGGSLPATGGSAAAPAPQVAPTTTTPVATRSFDLPGGLPVALIVAAIVGSGLIAFGLKRLPDSVLKDAGPGCNLEGQ